MPTTLPQKKSRQTQAASAERELLAASVFVALVFSVVTAALPAQSVLPVVGLVVISAGVILGGWTLALKRLQGGADQRLLDVSGVLVLFGFAAAMICDKSEALRLLGVLPGQ